MDNNTNEAERALTFGQRAVGLTFNPSNHPNAQRVKQESANLIDLYNDWRNTTQDPEVKRMLSVAITEMQTAQMWAVKAVTWETK